MAEMATATVKIDVGQAVELVGDLLRQAFEAGVSRTLCSCGTAYCKAERDQVFDAWLAEVTQGD